MRVALAALAAIVALAATSARAQVAVAITIAEEDASQRDIAGKVVSVAREKWQMLHPQLSSSQTKECPAGDTECLRTVASKAQASYLLVVGVAPLGVRDRVVAVQLFDVTKAAPLFEESVVQSGLTEDLGEVKALATRLIGVPGPPAYAEPPPFVPTAPEPASDIGAWTVGGYALTSAGGVAVVAALISAGVLFQQQKDPENGANAIIFGLSTGGALLGLGSIAFAVDAF